MHIELLFLREIGHLVHDHASNVRKTVISALKATCLPSGSQHPEYLRAELHLVGVGYQTGNQVPAQLRSPQVNICSVRAPFLHRVT